MMTSFFCLFGCSLLSFLLSKRTPTDWTEWRNLTWGKVCMIAVLFDSWLFTLFAGFLLTGVTVRDETLCSLVSILCIAFVSSSKFFTYAFLVEKVYIVWSNGYRTPRLKSPVYKICLLIQLGYGVVAMPIPVLLGRTSRILDDSSGACLVGFQKYASISIIVYDALQCLFFTFMFCWPLYRSKTMQMSPALRTVAKKTLIGVVLGLTAFTVNMLVFYGLGGHELDWVCITNCVLEVTANALILYWVSSGAPSDSIDHFTRSRSSVTLPTSTVLAGWAVGTPTSTNQNNINVDSQPPAIISLAKIERIKTRHDDGKGRIHAATVNF
ncbi:hypothetical protein V5O48_015340 [Marasmius crinis-equi]|uniref:Transmembrane protein n=1 Tax=Marasmius crinis-equi TaxID=585013 RepID=A0ABR3EUU0_9AGAR